MSFVTYLVNVPQEKLHSYTETGPAEGQEGYLLLDANKNRDPCMILEPCIIITQLELCLFYFG